MNSGQYEVLGTNHLRSGQKTFAPERKTAAILVYLAFEGPIPGSKLADLLWPNSEEATTRNNLSQTLRRLKQAAGEDVIVTGAALRLSEELVVDAARLRATAFWAGRRRSPLMPGSCWHRSTTTTCPSSPSGVEAEPISEAAYRHIMRLHYLLGDRPAALRAYARFKVMLEREVGVEPLSETGDLAQRIECGALQVLATARLREIPIGRLLKAAEIATAYYRLADADELYTCGRPPT